MLHYNNGRITTNDNCIGCNKCISGCPVIGANVAVVAGKKNRIEVNENKCIHCGHCMTVCSHNAREYTDDTERFFADLKAGEEISLAIAPSFYLIYRERAQQILGCLKKYGVKKIYDVGFGADIATWCHLKYFDENKDEKGLCPAYISAACPAVVNYIERYVPDKLPLLVPVQSPAVCLGIYVHKYLKETAKLALISPCITKKDEMESPETKNQIAYNVTFRHLMNYLEKESYENLSAQSDLKPLGLGGVLAMPGGLKECLDPFLSSADIVLRSDGMQKRADLLVSYSEDFEKDRNHPLFVDLLNCDYGCISGSATEKRYDLVSVTAQYQRIRTESGEKLLAVNMSANEKREAFEKAFHELDASDFTRVFSEHYSQPYVIPESTYEEIFDLMHKHTEESKNINCGFCGYKTCRDMAGAIAYGYGRKENCVHYANDEIMRLYYTDSLTGLPNEAAFIRDCEALFEENPDRKYIICTADINEFKVINDLYGFDGGDRVLKFLADKGRTFAGECGACARLDTDHFALCIPDEPAYTDNLIRLSYYNLGEHGVDFPVTLRFGLYPVGDKEEPVKRMLDFAAIAMNKIEDHSRNLANVYNGALREELLIEATVTSQMHDALQQGEFTVYFQPQYNHASGALVGAEALCRWIKKNGMGISPAEFIPIFEKNGFIKELDLYMWKSVFAEMRTWLDSGMEVVPVSVNISRITLQDEEALKEIPKIREAYSIPPELIHLEITESAYMQNQRHLIERVNILRGQGFHIAMDDFGSGYSSLNTLKDVPIDILKLDMGFLRGDSNMDKGGNIISSIVRMARGLKLSIIAEGVETIEQANFLKSVGCDVIQGYLYAKPMAKEKYAKLLEDCKKGTIEIPKAMEQIDINQFYNPNSGETKMFDYYAGAAMVFEFENNHINILRVNDKYLKQLRIEDEGVERVKQMLIPSLLPKSKQEMIEAIREAIRTGEEVVCVSERKLPNVNEPIWIKSHIWKIATNGESHIMYAIADDVSLEKNSEAELLRKNAQMDIILENSPAGICLFHGKVVLGIRKQIKDLSVVSVNKRFIEMTGYDEQAILHWGMKGAFRVIHPLDLPGFIKNMWNAVTGNKLSFSYVYRAKHANGSYVWIKIMLSSVLEPDGSFWCVTNFTETRSPKEAAEERK